MKKSFYFCLETLIKMAFIVGVFFMFFVLPYYIMEGKLFNVVWIDLICLQISMLIGCMFVVIINEIRKDCGRGVGIFFSIDKYREL
tara:strand:- start:36 stop:293 length:258 start_codon:yes stop_codon:yes gene_type:complete